MKSTIHNYMWKYYLMFMSVSLHTLEGLNFSMTLTPYFASDSWKIDSTFIVLQIQKQSSKIATLCLISTDSILQFDVFELMENQF